MTNQEKLMSDIGTLRDSIRLDWADIANLDLTPEEQGERIEAVQALTTQRLAELTAGPGNGTPPSEQPAPYILGQE